MAINRILKQVREQRHLGLEDVASFTKISLARLSEMETGDREPTYRQLEKLADTYGLPSYVFASDALPNLSETIPDFRRQQVAPAHLTPAGMRRILHAESTSNLTRQLATELKYKPPEWSKDVPTGEPTPALARLIREFFDDWALSRSTEFKFTGQPEQVFFGCFRTFLEVQGTIVNSNDAPPTDYLGFYIQPEAGQPLAFVNRKISSRKAQLFTLVHEFAHSLLQASGISNPFIVSNPIERACNRFTAEFLAPMESFRTLVEKASPTVRKETDTFVRWVARQTLLSQHATAIRLKEGGYLSEDSLRSWERTRAKFPAAEKEEEADGTDSRGAVHAKRAGELGYLPTYLSSQAVQLRLIDGVDVQTSLSLSEGLQEKAFSLVTRRFDAAQ